MTPKSSHLDELLSGGQPIQVSDPWPRLVGEFVLSGLNEVKKYISPRMKSVGVYVGGALALILGGSVLGEQYPPGVLGSAETYSGYRGSIKDQHCTVRPSDKDLQKILENSANYTIEQNTWNIRARGDEFSGIVKKTDEEKKQARVVGFRQHSNFFDAARTGVKGRAVWHLQASSNQHYFVGYELGEECSVGGAVLMCPYTLVKSGEQYDPMEDKHLRGKCVLSEQSQSPQP
jgi:hypothetical protein